MSSIFNEALERATNPQMPPPKSPVKTPNSPSRTSTLFYNNIRETIHTIPDPPPKVSTRPPTPRPDLSVERNVYVSGALPPLSLLRAANSEGYPKEIPIPRFNTVSSSTTSHLYISNYPEDEIDWSEPTPPLTTPHHPTPCRSFRDPHTAAEEERERHFATHGRVKLDKLIAAGNALRNAPPLSATGATVGGDSVGLDSTTDKVEVGSIRGCAGEPGSVYVPGWWRSQRVSEDDLFSDVAENGGDSHEDDDEEHWDQEFARAEEEVNGEGGDDIGFESGGLYTWPKDEVENAATKSTRVPASGAGADETISLDAAKATTTTSTDPAAAPYVRHTPVTASRDWAYPAAGAPSPTESQLVALGFEFHNELSEEEQIARFGDKAFRKALREVLPSQSRKQQWYAWQRVNDRIGGDRSVEGEGETSGKSLKEEADGESGECVCKCPGNGEECDGDDRTCAELLSECLCGDCEDCEEHYRWHYPEVACEIGGELEEETEGDRMPKCVCGEGKDEGGEAQAKLQTQAATRHTFCRHRADGELDALTSVGGCDKDERVRRCSPGQCAGEDCPTRQEQHHSLCLNPEVQDRPSAWTGSFPRGRLIDGEPIKEVRNGLDDAHDVPARSLVRIPGLDLLDRPPDPRLMPDEIRKSVEPETPRRRLLRDSTPAFEDRSPSPSPVSHKGNIEDTEMTDAPSGLISAHQTSRLPLPQPTSSPNPISSPMLDVTAPQTPIRPRSKSRSRSRSPVKAPVAPPDPVTSTPKSTKQGGRRKSAVQGSKVEKASTTKDKSRAVSRKVTAAVKDAAEKAGNRVKEAVARIEASVKGQEESTPRRSARIMAKIEREGTPDYGDG